MDKSHDNKNTQEELDFSAKEPIAAKPSADQKSFLSMDKLKNLSPFHSKRNESENRFTTRKEPTFGTMGINTDNHSVATPSPAQQLQQSTQFTPLVKRPSVTSTSENTVNMENQAVHSESPVDELQGKESAPNHTEEQVTPKAEQSFIFEPVPEPEVEPAQPNNDAITQSDWKRPETWAILQKLPIKHRRLFVVLLLAVLLLLLLWCLKPSSNSVENFQQNTGQAVPIEFQSLDPNQPLVGEINNPFPPADGAQPTPTEGSVSVSQGDTALQPAEQIAATPLQSNISPIAENASPAVVAPQVTQGTNVATTGKVEPPKAVVAKPEPVKPTTPTVKPVQPKVEQPKVKVAETKPQAKVETKKAAPIVDAKPVATAAKSVTSNTKTLTVPKGVSLMQVFRDNNLDIRDVNAMTKANGAGNVLSNLRAGEKVQVSLNSQGRVSELRLNNGARFIRQSDGSYQYRK